MAFQANVESWGPFNRLYWGTAHPTVTGEGPFLVGDFMVNTAPTGSGTFGWACTGAGTGATSTWAAVALAANA